MLSSDNELLNVLFVIIKTVLVSGNILKASFFLTYTAVTLKIISIFTFFSSAFYAYSAVSFSI